MVGNRLLMEASALPKKVKVTSLTQMVLRRCTNQVGRLSRELKTPHLSKLMYKMKVSGYCEKQRVKVLLAGLRCYRRMVRDEIEGKRPVNRPEWV